MFKKYYKAANDDIETNRELIDKIFETAEKPSKTVKFAKVYKYGTAVAAAFVVVVGAFLYPQIEKLNDTSQLSAESNQVTYVKKSEQISNEAESKKTEQPIREEEKQKIQQEISNQTVQLKTIVAETADMSATVSTAESENSRVEIASEKEDVQPFSIPEAQSSRMFDASSATDAKEIPVDSFKEISAEETENVQKFLRTAFGEKDEETGHMFLFEICGKADGMYLGRWKWFVIDHSSLLCEFVLNEELTEMYECIYTEDGAVQWNTQNNILD